MDEYFGLGIFINTKKTLKSKSENDKEKLVQIKSEINPGYAKPMEAEKE